LSEGGRRAEERKEITRSTREDEDRRRKTQKEAKHRIVSRERD